MARKKLGITVNCPVCNTLFYRAQCEIKRNVRLTCSMVCAGVRRRGEGNPFWGKKHPPEVMARIVAKNLANPPKGTGPKKGVFKHTPEAKVKMSNALKKRWQLQRADMLAYAQRGLNAPYTAISQEPRYKFIFTKTQKREWVDDHCRWCRTTEDLVLDHIIPIICGGVNVRRNAQTLCQDCNRWKMKYIDRPLYFALTGDERGSET